MDSISKSDKQHLDELRQDQVAGGQQDGKSRLPADVYFNTRVLARAAEEPSADDFKELFEWLDSTEETATSVAADQLETAAAEELADEETI